MANTLVRRNTKQAGNGINYDEDMVIGLLLKINGYFLIIINDHENVANTSEEVNQKYQYLIVTTLKHTCNRVIDTIIIVKEWRHRSIQCIRC